MSILHFDKKELVFFDFPVKLQDNYFKMLPLTKSKADYVLFGRSIDRIIVRHERLFGCSIEFQFDVYDDSFHEECTRRIAEKMGKPRFVRFDKKNVWLDRNITIASGWMGINHIDSVYTVTVYFYTPLTTRITNKKLETIDMIVRDAAERWGIKKYMTRHTIFGLSMAQLETHRFSYYFEVRGKKMKIRLYRELNPLEMPLDDYRTIELVWEDVAFVNSPEDIARELESFIARCQRHDKFLKQ